MKAEREEGQRAAHQEPSTSLHPYLINLLVFRSKERRGRRESASRERIERERTELGREIQTCSRPMFLSHHVTQTHVHSIVTSNYDS
jgi:hypothetical protein